jgi:hypothetical protein
VKKPKHIAQIHTKVCRTRKEQRIKEGYYRYPGESYLRIKTNTYVLKDIQKNIYKIGKTADPHARFKSLCVGAKLYSLSQQRR